MQVGVNKTQWISGKACRSFGTQHALSCYNVCQAHVTKFPLFPRRLTVKECLANALKVAL